eukprot:3196027-Prymnesium_polylepis.2
MLAPAKLDSFVRPPWFSRHACKSSRADVAAREPTFNSSSYSGVVTSRLLRAGTRRWSTRPRASSSPPSFMPSL